jgi:quercetin dioxygenase-like cupin family protein
MHRLIHASALLAFSLVAVTAAAQTTSPVVVTADQVKWAPAQGFPPDWRVAVLAGDLAKKVPYVQRFMLPPNAAIPAHTHPNLEDITVLSGSFGIGHDKSGDRSKGQVLTAGAFYRLPANTMHFAWAGPEGAVIQVNAIGPFAITMVKQ